MLPISLSSRSQQISDKKMYIPVKAVHIIRNTALHKSSPLDFYEHLTAVNQKDISSGPRFANTWHWQWYPLIFTYIDAPSTPRGYL